MNELQNERADTDVCPHCGEKYKYEYSELLGTTFHIMCDCQAKIREQEKAVAIEKCIVNMRNSLKLKAGLKKRQVKMTFESFNPLQEQKEAYDIMLKYAQQWNKDTEKGLILSGCVGSGKTHLACAVVNKIIENIKFNESQILNEYGRTSFYLDTQCPKIVKFNSSVEFLSELKKSFSDNSSENSEAIINNYKNIPLLVLDDIGAEKPTEWSQSLIYEIIDYRYNDYLPVIITTNLTVDKLFKHLGDRTVDRLREMCKITNILVESQRRSVK